MGTTMQQAIAYLDDIVQNQNDRLIQIFLAIYALVGLAVIGITLQKEIGHEITWIARALADGHGYSFPLDRAWLCSALCEQARQSGDYITSAWMDPIFTFLWAGLIYVFGEETARLIIRPLNLLFFCVACFYAAKTARHLAGPWAAILAVGFLVAATKHYATSIGTASLATLWISLIAYNSVRYFDDPSTKRASVLGVLLAVSALSASGTMLMIPVVGFIILLKGGFSLPAFRSSAITLLIAATLISPWTIRNYLAFGEFVPIRNGLGQIAWVGTVAAAGTYKHEVAKTNIPSPFSTGGPREVINGIIDTHGAANLYALEQWQEAVLDEQIPEKSRQFNEAQQDKWMYQRARDFVLENPITATQLAFFKVHAFMASVDFPIPYTGLLAAMMMLLSYMAIGGGLYLVMSRIELSGLILMLAAFMAPFAVIAPYYYRYRQPIEPVFAILVGVTLVVAVEIGSNLYKGRVKSDR